MSHPVFWIVDTRNIWQGTAIADAAPQALRLLNEDERDRAQRFVFLRDAKLNVASSLLKRLFVTKSLPRQDRAAWRDIAFTRSGDLTHGKPCHAPADGSTSPLDFNVSHQAGLVALVGCLTSEASLGVDIVCVHERNDLDAIARSGFEDWVDMHDSVFSPADIATIKARLPGEGLEDRIRRFYAFWALKEAYIKLVGEGLLAEWLTTVVFRNVRVPTRLQIGASQAFGETVDDIEVWRDGVQVKDVRLLLQAFEENHMIATAIEQTFSRSDRMEPAYRVLDVQTDVLLVAEQETQLP